MNAGHRSVPHTARFEAWAPTRDQCLAEAVAALVEGVADTACVSAAGQAQVWIEPLDDDDQLAHLLGEVVRRMNTDAVLPIDVEITQPQGGGLDVRLAVVPLRDVRLIRSLPERVVPTGVSMRLLGGQWFATFTLVLPG